MHERSVKPGNPPPRVFDRLCELGGRRIAEMDAAGIDEQVLSLTSPGGEQMEISEAIALARESNDYLAEAKKKYPARLAGFAAIATPSPEEAATELERTVRVHSFKGAAINGPVRGRYLDDKFFWPILESAEKLGVPIYLHPTHPPDAVIEASYGGFSPLLTDMLSGRGWHIETTVHLIHMIVGGVFDHFPCSRSLLGTWVRRFPSCCNGSTC